MFSLLRSIRAGGVCFAALVIAALLSASAGAQTSPPAQSKPAEPDKPPLKQEELDSICAPIALYPDQVLSQILMASTYPVEVIQAERWVKENKALKGKELTAALEKKEWDASTKSLVNFPSVLTMMSEKLDWTIKLGDAFIGQQADVMNTIQRLRAKAKTQGNLATNEQQKVVVEAAPAATQPTIIVEQVTPAPTEIIRIESASPQVVYVPTYNPTVVYGTWPYPSYPPAAYYPPGYVAGAAALSFGVGLAVGAAWGYAWGGCNWGGSDVDIDIDRNTNINTNIDRDKAKANMESRQGTRDTRQTDRQGGRDARQTNRQSGQGKFQHDPAHRSGVPYASNRDAQKFGGQSAQQAASARDSYRGRATAGQQDISRNGAGSYQNQVSAANRAGTGAGGAGNRASAGTANRAGAGGGAAANRSSPAANRSTPSSGSRGSAFSGSNSSGSSARAASQRGASSRSSAPARSAPRSGGGGRAGGGGRR